MENFKNEIYYEAIINPNAKQNLVFVHGSGCNRKCLRSLAKKLPDFNCYLPDLPDHGKSKVIGCKKVEEYVEAIVDFVKDMENVTIVGHSLGGSICLGVAAKAVPSVKRCVVISGGAKFDKMDQRIHNMVKRQKVDWGYLIPTLGSLTNPSVIRAMIDFESPDVVLKDFALDLELDLEYTLKDIKIPMLIMVSQEDILTIPEYSEKINRAVKNSKLVYISNCRHMLPIAKRKEVSKLIREFVAN